ncbi:XRE family transcriptional regulator [Streptomyces sp. NPDC059881]|uniref:MmyB family transcriptional regulator n=1 Tax=Streptomyces sp. NPDC059881 TaxID=3346986 RepID=UPI00364C543F
MQQVGVLQQILRARRQAIAPEDVGLSRRSPGSRRGPRVSGLTQTDVDFLMDRGVGTYQKVESGALRPSQEYVLELARVLRFEDSEYVYAHLELFGTEPVQPLNPDAGLMVPPSWQRALAGQREMAYVNDRRYDLRLHNEAFADMFPSGALPANTMEWMLLSDEARDFCLEDWDTEWGPRVIPQFRAALAAHPDDPVLNRIHDRVLKDKRARSLYERGEDVYIHPDGDTRPLHHAKLGRGFATMIAAQPLSSPGARYMTILFDPVREAAA